MVNLNDFKQIQKHRIKGTHESIRLKLDNIDEEQIRTELFVKTDNEYAKGLLEKVEGQMLLVKTDPQKFRDTLYAFLERTGKEIVRQSKVPEFLDFTYFLYTELNSDGTHDKNVISAYMDLMMQLNTHLYKEKWVFGVCSGSMILTMDEIFPKLDYPMIELQNIYGRRLKSLAGRKTGEEKIISISKRYGYEVSSLQELVDMMLAEQKIHRQVSLMAPFINETTLDINGTKYFKSTDPGEIPNLRYVKYIDEDISNNRTHTLPFDGVRALCKNLGSIAEIILKERVYFNRLHLLFNIDMGNMGSFNGFIDIERDISFTMFCDSTNFKDVHNAVIRIIKEVYWRYICDASEDVNITLINDVSDCGELPCIQFINKEKQTSRESSGKLDKSKYTVAESVIAPFIRRLRDGQKASEEAVKRALDYGYILKDGETFVRQHTKKVYKR